MVIMKAGRTGCDYADRTSRPKDPYGTTNACAEYVSPPHRVDKSLRRRKPVLRSCRPGRVYHTCPALHLIASKHLREKECGAGPFRFLGDGDDNHPGRVAYRNLFSSSARTRLTPQDL